MQTTNWPELAKASTAELKNLRGGASDVMKAFSSIAQAALAQGALDHKTKELIAIGISVAVRCDDCIAFHVKAAVDRGATSRGSPRNARHGDLYGSRPLGDVRQPCARRLHAIRREEVR